MVNGLNGLFILCGARLTVYVLFAVVFFMDNIATIVFALYFIEILVAVRKQKSKYLNQRIKWVVFLKFGEFKFFLNCIR
jgi:Fe2+ transport system protein B